MSEAETKEHYTIEEVDRKQNPFDGSVNVTYRVLAAKGCRLCIENGSSAALTRELHFKVIVDR